MTWIEIGILGSLGVGMVVAWYYALVVLKDAPLSQDAETVNDADAFPVAEWDEITNHDLGQIEANINGLVQVIVAAHQVEEPMNALRAAVKKNLHANVEYHFLVSKSRAEAERKGWIKMFLTIAEIVLDARGSKDVSAHDLVHISKLDYDWRDTPYVFYRSKTAAGQLATIGFRGNQTDEGIAEKYVRLPAWLAYSMALAILSDAPEQIKVVPQSFNVVPEISPDVLTRIGPSEEQHAGIG